MAAPDFAAAGVSERCGDCDHDLRIHPARPGVMPGAAAVLVAGSAAVILLLGVVHLVYTFRGARLHPRDPALRARMAEVSPRISGETTMWKAWVGFNASHSYGAILFGLVYGYLALAHAHFLFRSTFLLAVGVLLLAGYAFLGKAYWFSIPFRGVTLALALFLAGWAAAA